MIRTLVGEVGAGTDPASIVARLRSGAAGAAPLRVGDPRAVDALAELSRALLHGPGRRHPELVVLASFLRPAAVHRLLAGARGRVPADVRVVPRGLVFHVPPANVDTIFVYSWALSLLAGNANIVRLSDRTTGPAADALLDALRGCLGDPALSASQAIVAYGHDDETTRAFSAACDLRMVWGGDAAVAAVRAFPLAPSARDLAFPDRFSLAAVGPGYLDLGEVERDAVAVGLYNDAYWFDQAACASPRLLVFVGDDARRIRADLWARLDRVVSARHPGLDAGAVVDKRVAAADLALGGAVRRVEWTSSSLVGLELAPGAAVHRGHLGIGAFQLANVAALRDLAPLVERRDQTLVHAGLAPAELDDLTDALNGRGIDRIVPIGDALGFGPLWDGEDLLEHLTRRVQVVATAPRRLS